MALRLVRRTDVPETERVYRASQMNALVFVAIVLGIAAALLIYHKPSPRASYWFAGAILVLLWLLHRFIWARFLSSNWLVRQADDGLFIHFRSYLNYRMSEDDLTVVFVPYSSIRSARLVRERITTRDMENQATTQTLRIVELELADDTTQLAEALAIETGRLAPMEKHRYSKSSTLFRHYPVRMPVPPFLRVEWQVMPGAKAFLKTLPAYLPIAPPVLVTEDFANLGGLSRDQQERRLRELDERGQTIAAVYMARRLYGYDLTEATNFVDNLRGVRS